MKIIYKVLTPTEWAEASRTGSFSGSALDRRDGFIHLSSGEQVVETVSRHFVDSGMLVLVAVSVAGVGANLRFEPSRGGESFPHLYADLKLDDVLWAKPFDSNALSDLQALVAD